MKAKFVLTLLLVPFICTAAAKAATPAEALSLKAVAANPEESRAAIAELRSRGPAGLEALFSAHADLIKGHVSNSFEPNTDDWQRLTAALDAVSQQKDSYLSHLYWYTDLSQAEAASKASGKPILSLRLLGNLNEEFSCANSRFFRTVLYSNAAVSDVLRERFILHWQSVRPAPHITIDFGDGRKLERTITGNSIHYIVDSDGEVIDALPGLYGPTAFLRNLSIAEKIYRQVADLTREAKQRALSDYHAEAVKGITAKWIEDARMVGGKVPDHLLPKGHGRRAVDIAPLAITKGLTEFSILQAITRDTESLKAVTDEATWSQIAWRHMEDAKLDQQSVNLIHREMQSLWSKDAIGEAKLRNLVKKFQYSTSLDSVRNEYVMHTQLHAWLAAGFVSRNVDALNEKVYAELFLTPKSDPWLGLTAEDVYVGLEHGGMTP